jgi:DNA anti-recombination protein RmuC
MNRTPRATKQITLHVRHEFELPAVYGRGNSEEVEEALFMGASVQQSIKTRRSSDDIRKVTEAKDIEIQRIHVAYTEKLAKVGEDLQAITAEKDRIGAEYLEKMRYAQSVERETCSKESEERIRLLRKEHEIMSARYDALEARRHVLEESRDKDIQDAVRRTEEFMQKVVSSKEEQLVKMEAAYHRLQESIAKQSEEITKLSSTLGKRAANVKTKGSDYEEQFGEKLKRNYGLCRGFKLHQTHLGAGHEMDFSMEMEGQVVMWELKNYSAVVPKAEVDKFLRDLKENPQAKVGVMISRTTDIYGKSAAGALVTEFDSDKMMIYINRFEDFCGEEEHKVFAMLQSLFRIWWEYHHEERHGLDRAEIVRELEKAVEDIAKRRTEWRRHKAHLDEMGRWTADLLDESEDRLDRLLKKARHTEELSTGPLVIPEAVFRESGEEKEMNWIRSIMRVCVPGGMIEVRELVDLLGAYHKLTKDTIRSNVMSIIKDSAVIKKGVIKYIQGISKYVPPCAIQFSK